MTSRQQPIGIGDVFDALSESDRRTALWTLRRHSTPIELDALAERVADRTDETTESEMRATLHHAHLPKLDGLGLLDYDASEQTVHCDWDDDDVAESLRDAKQVLDGLERGDA